MTSQGLFVALLALLAGLRLLELARSRRNERELLARGGRPTGPGHFRFMFAVHAALFVLPALEVFSLDRPFIPALGLPALAVVAGAFAVRWHVMSVLGFTWSARAVVAREMPVCDRGLYRFVRHPNYLAVLLEVPALPLVHTAWISALVLGLANAVLIAVRIRQEEAALFEVPGYREKMGAKARLIPGVL